MSHFCFTFKMALVIFNAFAIYRWKSLSTIWFIANIFAAKFGSSVASSLILEYVEIIHTSICKFKKEEQFIITRLIFHNINLKG